MAARGRTAPSPARLSPVAPSARCGPSSTPGAPCRSSDWPWRPFGAVTSLAWNEPQPCTTTADSRSGLPRHGRSKCCGSTQKRWLWTLAPHPVGVLPLVILLLFTTHQRRRNGKTREKHRPSPRNGSRRRSLTAPRSFGGGTRTGWRGSSTPTESRLGSSRPCSGCSTRIHANVDGLLLHEWNAPTGGGAGSSVSARSASSGASLPTSCTHHDIDAMAAWRNAARRKCASQKKC